MTPTSLTQWRQDHPGPPRRPAGTVLSHQLRQVVRTDEVNTKPIQLHAMTSWVIDEIYASMGAIDMRQTRTPGVVLIVGQLAGAEEVAILTAKQARSMARQLMQLADKVEGMG